MPQCMGKSEENISEATKQSRSFVELNTRFPYCAQGWGGGHGCQWCMPMQVTDDNNWSPEGVTASCWLQISDSRFDKRITGIIHQRGQVHHCDNFVPVGGARMNIIDQQLTDDKQWRPGMSASHCLQMYIVALTTESNKKLHVKSCIQTDGTQMPMRHERVGDWWHEQNSWARSIPFPPDLIFWSQPKTREINGDLPWPRHYIGRTKAETWQTVLYCCLQHVQVPFKVLGVLASNRPDGKPLPESQILKQQYTVQSVPFW